MEQLIVILVFAICAAVCVRIFTGSYIMANESRDTKNSLIAAENGAECFKAFAGDAGKVAVNLGGSCDSADDGFLVTVCYDKEWQACAEADAAYVMRISSRGSEEYASLLFGDISVEKVTGEEIISFTVCARGNVV